MSARMGSLGDLGGNVARDWLPIRSSSHRLELVWILGIAIDVMMEVVIVATTLEVFEL